MSKTILIQNKETDTEIKYRVYGSNIEFSVPGSEHWKDILTALFSISHNTEYGGVHKGVWDALDSVYDQIQEIIPDNVNYVKISGHSLGGGLGTLLAYRLMLDYRPPKIDLFVDGSIKVISSSVCEFMEDYQGFISVFKSYRNDPVPLLFPWYTHPGLFQKVGGKREFPWIDLDIINGDHMNYWEK